MISPVFFCLSKLLFSGFLLFKGNFVLGQINVTQNAASKPLECVHYKVSQIMETHNFALAFFVSTFPWVSLVSGKFVPVGRSKIIIADKDRPAL